VKPNTLEQAIFQWIKDHNDSEVLHNQVDTIEIVSREHKGQEIHILLKYPENTPPLPEIVSSQIFCPLIQSAKVNPFAGVSLHTSLEGMMDLLVIGNGLEKMQMDFGAFKLLDASELPKV